MADQGGIFDDEPQGGGPDRQPAPPAGGSWPVVSRRRFVAGAGAAAAAGAAVGVIGTLGISALLDDDEATGQVATTPGGQGASPTGELGVGYPGYLGGVPAGVSLDEAVIALNVNGHTYRVGVTPNMSLAEVLRQELGFTGTKIGCDRSECSACTVLVDGVAVNSCSLLAIREEGKSIATIEGLERNGELNPVQEGFVEEMGLQCGFCTPGQIMQATGLLLHNAEPTEADIRRYMSGNLCKCAAYPNIISAVQRASKNWNNWSL